MADKLFKTGIYLSNNIADEVWIISIWYKNYFYFNKAGMLRIFLPILSIRAPNPIIFLTA